MQKKDIKNFTLNEFQEEVKDLGVEKYRATQLFDLLYKKGIEDFKEMSNLPTSFRDLLQKIFYVNKMELVELAISKDKTEKYLFKLEDGNLIEVCKKYAEKTDRQVTFEYILIKGVNDSLNYADKLAKLIGGFNSKINLITFNPAPGSLLQAPGIPQVKAFKDKLVTKGIPTTIRRSKGGDISAACGQLKSLHLK